jgi:hypothetical protein
MAKIPITVRLEEGDVEFIERVAVEGNVSQWIRLLVLKELGELENGNKK